MVLVESCDCYHKFFYANAKVSSSFPLAPPGLYKRLDFAIIC